MQTNWTVEQKNAITISDCNTLVSAAAGSGKTAVLVERVIDMITNEKKPVYINQLLIATFTNAAATEMMERIHIALQEKISQHPDNTFLREQSVLLGQAQISTIHSLCTNLIRENFHLLGIRHDFDIADKASLSVMKKKSLEEVLELAYINGNPDFLKTVDAFGGKKDDSNLSKIVLSVYDYCISLPKPEEWLDNCIVNLENGNTISLCKEIISDRFSEFENTAREYEKALEVIQSDEGLLGYYDVFYNEYLLLKRIAKQEFDEDFIKYISDFKAERLTGKKKCADPENTEYVKKIRDMGKKHINDFAFLCSYTDDEIGEETDIMLPYVKTICSLVKEFTEVFSAKKLAENLLDFNDLEHYAIKLLEENEDLTNSLKKFYKEILVDEYQDTNGVQAYLFELLSNGNNLFMVGDVKQSIYGFRNSNPKFFIDKYDKFSFDYEKDGTKINLAKNFRSSNSVINSVNRYFEKLMINELGGVEYNREQALVYGNESIKDVKNPVERYLINTGDADITENCIDKADAEAVFVANKIHQLVEKDKIEIFDKSINGYRNIMYKDIVILLRKTKDVAEKYARILGERNIPVYTAESGGYFDCTEIATIMSFLRIIENPLQDIPILAVMRSPIYSFDDNLIGELRAENEKISFYDLLRRSENPKAVSFISNLKDYREFAKYNDIGAVVRKLVFDTGYYQFVGGLSNGETRMMNLKLLCERANVFSQKGFKGVSQFISFVNNMIENESEYSSQKSISDSENFVTIMSIHKSKGLEFPVVFLCETSKLFYKKDLSMPCLYDEKLGIAFNIVDVNRRLRYTPYVKIAMREKKLDELISEEIRLLYVALTRAKHKIVITGTQSGYDIPVECVPNYSYSIRSKTKYSDWLFGKIDGMTEPEVYDMEKVSKMDLTISEHQSKTGENRDFTEFYEEICKILDYKYPYENSKSIPSKISISEAVDKDYGINLTEINEESSSMSSTQRGTLIHFVLQNIDLSKVGSKDEINAQLLDMIDKNIFSKEYLDYIDIDGIYSFFISDIGKRMLNSKQVYREFKFCVDFPANKLGYDTQDETVLMQGVIDCCFLEEGCFVIIDYKTGSLHEKYKKQLELYKQCLEISTGKKVKETHIYPLI